MPPPSSKSCVETTQPKDWDTVKTESSTSEKISECFIIFILKSIHTQSNHGQYSIQSSPTREERQMRSPDRGLRQYTCILVIFKSNQMRHIINVCGCFSPCITMLWFCCRWFQGFDWDGLLHRKLVPPIIPQVSFS